MDRTALITGASRGIGLATTKRFLAAKFNVIALARNTSDIPHDVRGDCRCIDFDLRQIAEIKPLVEEIGDVDVLINNAGVMHGKPLSAYRSEMQRDIFDVNLFAPIELIHQLSEGMKSKRYGRIVNNTSIAAQIGHPDIWYGATKAGLLNATKSFAEILGPFGIVINSVAAGPVETDMLSTIPPERQDAIKKAVFTGRFSDPSEIAETMYWLATDCPEYINGTCVDINNGAFRR